MGRCGRVPWQLAPGSVRVGGCCHQSNGKPAGHCRDGDAVACWLTWWYVSSVKTPVKLLHIKYSCQYYYCILWEPGEEGYRSKGPLAQGGVESNFNWINNGMKGVDFPLNSQCQHLDYMTVHVYPDNWNVAYEVLSFTTNNFMRVGWLVIAKQTAVLVPLP